MKTNIFGDPRPLGAAEITQAIEEKFLDASMAMARIDREDHDDGFGGKGWCAEIAGEPDEDSDMVTINTLAYPTKEQLIADLEAVGIADIEVE